MTSLSPKKLFKPSYLIILLATMITYQIICEKSIYPNVPHRMYLEKNILSHKIDPPYKYRIIEPYLGYYVQKGFAVFASDKMKRHTFAYQTIMFFCLLGIFLLFHAFLRRFFSEVTSLLGIVLLAIVIPLSISSYWQDGDFYNLLFFLIGLNLIFKDKDVFIPIVIGVGVFNRTHIIFLIIFYMAYLYKQKTLHDKRSILIVFSCIVAFFVSYFSMRLYFGADQSQFTLGEDFSENISIFYKIMHLWIIEVMVFIVLSLLAFKRSSRFFKFTLISLFICTVFFFFNSVLTQLAKFLPAYLILIPMSLQILSGETTLKKV